MIVRQPFFIEPGRTLGPHYIVEGSLGSGWEGEVYRVRERRTGIIRAAKIFYDQKGVREAPFLRYARKLYKLKSCPIIIQYHHHDSVQIESRRFDFLVSDFVEGEVLSDFLNRQPHYRLSHFEALHLIYSMAIGLEQIHHLGEYHGDIHSDNVMVKRIGIGFDVHLIDFFDLGRSTKAKIQNDVINLVSVFYDVIGRQNYYSEAPEQIKRIIQGRKRGLISAKYKNAGQLRQALETLQW
jgi:serine/threonine protein kinase